MNKWFALGLIAVLLLAGWLRLSNLDWDDLYHVHPDERYIVWVGTTIELPTDWATAFDPTRSTFNPFYWPAEAESPGIVVEQGKPRDFAYGHWPLYLGVAAAHLLQKGSTWAEGLPESWGLLRDLLNGPGRIEYNHLLLVGRALAALADTATVWLVYLLGRRLFGRVAGLSAAAMIALAVLHIQQAHFFVTDPFLTTVVVAAVYWMVRRAQSGRLADSLASGALVGLAVGAKFSAIMLVLPLALAFTWGRPVPPGARAHGWKRRLGRWWRWLRRPAAELAASLTVALLVFGLTNPFALLDTTCEAVLGGWTLPLVNLRIGPLEVGSCYLENIGTQGVMVRGSDRIPFTFQYIGTQPYWYYLDQMVRWGLGAPLALACFGGLVWAVWRTFRRSTADEAVVLAWALPFFLVTGSFQVKFLRYLLPLTPFLTIYGAGMIWSWLGPTDRSPTGRSPRRLLAGLFLGGTLLWSALWALAFVGLYRAGEHPWVAASRWLIDNAPAGSTIATEHWDHALPLSLRDDNDKPVGSRFPRVELVWYDVEDRREKEEDRVPLADALRQVARSDYVILASNRLYGVIPRLPERYPEVSAYYPLLFSGELGFDLVHWSARYPTLGPITVMDDAFDWPGLVPPAPLDGWRPTAGEFVLELGPADESFTVYDHPLVLVFQNRGRLTARELEKLIRAELDAGDP